jgi:integrase
MRPALPAMRLSPRREELSSDTPCRLGEFYTTGQTGAPSTPGEAAELGFKVHPHMLRHACGFALANKGHDTSALQAYLGHRNIQHTVRYTEL